MSWISARIRFTAAGEADRSISADDAERVVDQVRNDSLFGTFAELDDEFWKDRMERNPTELSEAFLVGTPEDDPKLKLTRYEFELRLAADLFPAAHGGAQHLFGILAGDLLRFTLPPITIRKIEVRELKFPDDWAATQFDAFRRDRANAITDIRKQFKLESGMPLLAFSFKPRVGFKLDSLEEVATDVLNAGFNLVELDTRFLAQDPAQLDALREIASRIARASRKHIGRFSINLSLPPDIVLDQAEKLSKGVAPPVTIKIDGGLDGMSSLQILRRRRIVDTNGQPIVVTCYPLLRSTLAQFVPSDSFVWALASSGADVLYPGGRPDLGWMVRSLGGGAEAQQGQVALVRRYRGFVKNNWPMPSIAGGIYAGQLQGFYEILGPDVAWFLGGGVALHKDGPAAGARLCVQIAKESAELRAKAGRDWAEKLRGKLPEESEEMYRGRSSLADDQLRYVSPREHLAKVKGLKPIGAGDL